MDEQLRRTLREFYATSPDLFGLDHYRLRRELLKAGMADAVGLMVGDLVEIHDPRWSHAYGPTIQSPWIGRVRRFMRTFTGDEVIVTPEDFDRITVNESGYRRFDTPDHMSRYERFIYHGTTNGFGVNPGSRLVLLEIVNPDSIRGRFIFNIEKIWIAHRFRRNVNKVSFYSKPSVVRRGLRTRARPYHWMPPERANRLYEHQRCDCGHIREAHLEYRDGCANCTCQQFIPHINLDPS